MNNQDREKLRDLIDELSGMQESEQEKYDNAPENLQESERVEKFQENADQIQEAIDILEYIWRGKMEHEPLKDKKQLINSWEYDNAIAEYRECDHGIYTFYADDVKSAVKGLREEIDGLDIPVDQKFKIVGLFSKWFYDVIVGGK